MEMGDGDGMGCGVVRDRIIVFLLILCAVVYIVVATRNCSRRIARLVVSSGVFSLRLDLSVIFLCVRRLL